LDSGSVIFYGVYGLILLIFLLLSATASGSEVAFFTLNNHQISECKKSMNRIDQLIYKLISEPQKLLATILILNNFVNIGIVTISTFMAWKYFGTNSLEGIVVVGLTFAVTFMLVFFGEITPKVYANPNALKVAKFVAPFLFVLEKLFSPVSWFLLSMSDLIEKRIEKKAYRISTEVLQQALEITTEKTSDEEREILEGIVKFGNLTVRQVMRARLDITAYPFNTDFHSLLNKIKKTGYSRIPIYRDTIDNIEGILYTKDLLPYLESEKEFAWQTLLRPGYFVPENKKIDSLLKDFQEKRVHMAVVVDEYGGTSGLITMEDVIEEIVGEINDEFDEDEIHFNKLDENTYIFESKTSLNDFCKVIGIDPEIFDPVKGESESLGGLLLELHGKLPRIGEKVEYKNFVFTTVAVDNKRIKRVRVFIKSQKMTDR
jgi:gliding motility-associated protein GldE